MTLALPVALAGAAGAMARYAIDGAVQRRSGGVFPAGTFVVNISGAFVIGFLAGLFSTHGRIATDIRVIVVVGFVGAYTTFSTWMYESVQLLRDGASLYAMLNIFGSASLGVLVAAGGLWIGERL